MPTWSLTVEVPEADADEVAALLVDGGAAGVEVRDATVAAMPGTRRPPAGGALLVASFARRGDAEAAARGLGLAGDLAEVPDEDWGESWKRGLAPLAIGRVFIRPSWAKAAAPPGAREVVLDPGMAFGTGTHPTTAMCLSALDRLLAERPGASVLDVGTGSGILAIAARKLGAGRVVATENDPVALRVAAENAGRNGVDLELALAAPDAIPGRFDIVLANILANALVELAPGMSAKVAPEGALILCGLVAGQEEEVRAAFAACGLAPDRASDAAEGEWRLVALRAPPERPERP
jgi:ribosomal protein L11 methyltransferase